MFFHSSIDEFFIGTPFKNDTAQTWWFTLVSLPLGGRAGGFL